MAEREKYSLKGVLKGVFVRRKITVKGVVKDAVAGVEICRQDVCQVV